MSAVVIYLILVTLVLVFIVSVYWREATQRAYGDGFRDGQRDMQARFRRVFTPADTDPHDGVSMIWQSTVCARPWSRGQACEHGVVRPVISPALDR